MTTLPSALRDATMRWIADDVDPASRGELQHVLAAALAGDERAQDDIADRMAAPLRFGTAGLRGPLRAGRNGMNRAVVVRTSAGVASWLAGTGHGGGVVVIGRDARAGSAEFAADAAGVFAAAGFDVHLLDGALPTPVLAFAVRLLGAVVGVQITASHNPATDNGYKLYDGTGAQIVPPADAQIEAAITAAPAACAVPRASTWTPIRDEVLEPYLRRVAALPRGTDRELKIALTPLHGVGGAVAVDALSMAGFTDVVCVDEQFTPDPGFGGMSFPNPEEPGVCDMLVALAERVRADLAIAFDPDADRCAIGISVNGGFRMLSGDEAGALIGDYILAGTREREPLVATTIVSSSMLRSIAASRGARYAETLTGFKWLVRAGDGLRYAYEEALGHCVDPDAVRDKDGISAAVVATDLVATCKASGGTLVDLLDQLAVAHGVHLTEQVSHRVADLDLITQIMRRLRADPPNVLARLPVDVEDLLPDADLLRFTGEGIRVIVRPSGTEPKVKAYLQVVVQVSDQAPPDDTDGLGAAKADARALLAALRADVRTLLSLVSA